MPWTGQQFQSRHNHSLSPAKAGHAAKVANAILKRTGDEGLAIATANAREKPKRAAGGSLGPNPYLHRAGGGTVSRERRAEILSRGRGQSPETDLNLTPLQKTTEPPGPLDVTEDPSWIPQPMLPDTGGVMKAPPLPGMNKAAAGGMIRRDDGGGVSDPNAAGEIAPTQATASPQMQDMMQRFAGMPAEQLQEAVIRMGPTTPMGALASRVLAQKRSMPSSQQQGFTQPGQRGMPRAPAAAQPNLQPGIAAEQATGSGLGKALGQIIDEPGTDVQPQGFAMGGMPSISLGQMDPPWTRSAMSSMGKMPTQGFLRSPVPGRTDHIAGTPAVNSFVVPADVLGGMGQGNPEAGFNFLRHAIASGPYGSSLPRGGGGRGPPRAPAPMRMQSQGGRTETTPVMLAGAEGVLTPEEVAAVGGGDIKRGFKILEALILHVRKKTIAELKRLPGAVKS